MTKQGYVQVVTDDSACLAPEVAKRLGIRVLPLKVLDEENEVHTAALTSLECCAAYARGLERSLMPTAEGDTRACSEAGVVALHVGKGLSATWSNAKVAAGVLENVEVVDTETVGAGIGAAAIAAAKKSLSGASLAECVAAAEDVLKRYRLWFCVPKLEPLRKGGRISTGQAVLSTALAMKPIVSLQDGALALVSKCRTEAKMKERLVDYAVEMVQSAMDEQRPPHVLLHHADALDDVTELQEILTGVLPEGTKIRIVELPPSLVVHTGPGTFAIGVITGGSPDAKYMEQSIGEKPDPERGSGVRKDIAERLAPVSDVAEGKGYRAVVSDAKGTPLFTTVASKLPTWSENRRAALEKADRLAKAITELARRDSSDPEGAAFGRSAADEVIGKDVPKAGENKD